MQLEFNFNLIEKKEEIIEKNIFDLFQDLRNLIGDEIYINFTASDLIFLGNDKKYYYYILNYNIIEVLERKIRLINNILEKNISIKNVLLSYYVREKVDNILNMILKIYKVKKLDVLIKKSKE